VNNESVICYSAASSPSGAHGGGWEGLGKDGEEAALHFSIRSDALLAKEIEMLRNDIYILTSNQFII